MDAVTQEEMKEIEEHAFEKGVLASELMDLAGKGIAIQIQLRFPKPGHAIAFLGKGNNAGDALVALKELYSLGWDISVHYLHAFIDFSKLPSLHLNDLIASEVLTPFSPENYQPSVVRPCVLLDGLLGIGSEGPLRSPLDELAAEMLTLRNRGARVIAMDIPSGIHANTGEVYDGAVVADHTCSVALPKRGILQESAINKVGSISHIPLPELQKTEPSELKLISPCAMPSQRRPFDFHKGQAGRVGIIAGSQGMLGAACLSGLGALRAGAGLVTLFCTKDISQQLAIKAPQELLVQEISEDTSLEIFSKFDALVIGPGLGNSTDQLAGLIQSLLTQAPCPLVIDADGLNFVARKQLFSSIPSCSVLTPHPGEMKRLLPDLGEVSREQILHEATQRNSATILFKGARTLISQQGSPVYVNGTGSPAMATAGQGDVLSGVIAALIGQNHENMIAACMGAWLCGRASEMAILDQACEALVASDTLNLLGSARKEWNLMPRYHHDEDAT